MGNQAEIFKVFNGRYLGLSSTSVGIPHRNEGHEFERSVEI